MIKINDLTGFYSIPVCSMKHFLCDDDDGAVGERSGRRNVSERCSFVLFCLFFLYIFLNFENAFPSLMILTLYNSIVTEGEIFSLGFFPLSSFRFVSYSLSLHFVVIFVFVLFLTLLLTGKFSQHYLSYFFVCACVFRCVCMSPE